jgi:hypothetical protein
MGPYPAQDLSGLAAVPFFFSTCGILLSNKLCCDDGRGGFAFKRKGGITREIKTPEEEKGLSPNCGDYVADLFNCAQNKAGTRLADMGGFPLPPESNHSVA